MTIGALPGPPDTAEAPSTASPADAASGSASGPVADPGFDPVAEHAADLVADLVAESAEAAVPAVVTGPGRTACSGQVRRQAPHPAHAPGTTWKVNSIGIPAE